MNESQGVSVGGSHPEGWARLGTTLKRGNEPSAAAARAESSGVPKYPDAAWRGLTGDECEQARQIERERRGASVGVPHQFAGDDIRDCVARAPALEMALLDVHHPVLRY